MTSPKSRGDAREHSRQITMILVAVAVLATSVGFPAVRGADHSPPLAAHPPEEPAARVLDASREFLIVRFMGSSGVHAGSVSYHACGEFNVVSVFIEGVMAASDRFAARRNFVGTPTACSIGPVGAAAMAGTFTEDTRGFLLAYGAGGQNYLSSPSVVASNAFGTYRGYAFASERVYLGLGLDSPA